MPHPRAGFPIPPFEWPHVGRQWPAHNVESDQAHGLRVWSPFLGSYSSDTVRDLSGHDTPGTLTNSAHWISDPRFGHVIHCDEGNSDYITWGTGIFAADIDFTVAVWIKTSDTWDTLYGCRGPGSADGAWRIISLDTNQGVRFNINTIEGDSINTDASTQIVDGKWHHIVCLRRGGTPEIYVDGAFDNSGAAAGGTFHSGNAMTLGGAIEGAAYATVTGFDFRIYQLAVTPTVISQMYDPPTQWELFQIPRRLWRLGAIAPPPAGQPMHLRALDVPYMRQWQPGRR